MYIKPHTEESEERNTMKLPHLLKSTTLALALAVGLGAHAYADEEGEGKDEVEQNVEMKDLPSVVQKTIQDSLAGGAVTNIEKESENGKTHYSADAKKDTGDNVEIKVAEDGNLIKVSPDDVKEEENEDED
jgi:uncharacterized membrane protein YkoI